MNNIATKIIVFLLILATLLVWSAVLDIKASEIDDWENYIEEVCEERNICPELVQAIIEKESAFVIPNRSMRSF